MPPELVRLMVAEVDVAVPAGPGVEAGMVVLSEVDEPHRRLKIIIGKPEVRAIQAAWVGSVPSRPSTWDLYVSTVAMLEARVDRVVITAVEEDRHFYARVEMQRAGEQRVLACRPSDAIAVALRAYGAEIYAVPAVLDAAGLRADGTKHGPWTWPDDDGSSPESSPLAPGTIGSPPAGALAEPVGAAAGSGAAGGAPGDGTGPRRPRRSGGVTKADAEKRARAAAKKAGAASRAEAGAARKAGTAGKAGAKKAGAAKAGAVGKAGAGAARPAGAVRKAGAGAAKTSGAAKKAAAPKKAGAAKAGAAKAGAAKAGAAKKASGAEKVGGPARKVRSGTGGGRRPAAITTAVGTSVPEDPAPGG